MKQLIQPGLLSGTVTIPASKSDAQRAILCAALANGTSVLTGVGASDDEQAMQQAVSMMGAMQGKRGNELRIQGIRELPEGLELSAGESGLGLRLLTCVAAAFSGKVVLTGQGSLLSRPMHFFDEVLPQFGCSVKTSEGLLPIEVQGPMWGRNLEVDGSLSSQFISGLLMALPLSSQASSLTDRNMKSGSYIQMTIRTLQQFGIEIKQDQAVFHIAGNQVYQATDYAVEGDWSSASYWLVAAALGHPVTVAGLSMRSLQADKALLDALMVSGCKVLFENGAIRVDGTALHAFEFDATDCPDLFPALVVLAAKCSGLSRIKGVNRLTHKESDRGLALQSEFGKMGLRIILDGDVMEIHGTGTLRGAQVEAHHDHRIAMCLGIAGSIALGETVITDADAVSKSYPDFWKHFQLLQPGFAV